MRFVFYFISLILFGFFFYNQDSAIASVSCKGSQDKYLHLYQVDPLIKVLKERNYFRDETDTIRVARGEVASIQIVVHGQAEIKIRKRPKALPIPLFLISTNMTEV